MTTQADLFAFLAEYVAPNHVVSTQDERLAQWIEERRSVPINSAVVQELNAFYAEYVAGTQDEPNSEQRSAPINRDK